MNTTALRTTKQFMTTGLGRMIAGAALSAALLTVAAPAMAQNAPEPPGGSVERTAVIEPVPPTGPVPEASSVDLSSAALGALGGLALAGAGLGVTLAIQRRRDHATAHPA
jgi:hypothetical protein